MRSSWLASETKRRIRSSDASWTANASSIWVSIALSDAASEPTSVVGGAGRTRRDRSPAAMSAAVSSISRSGRSARWTAR
ncbi:Uncharacterised protein [Mycobacteroides abscessus]|nr:Uncharacterised protein [Mycobacteroides abscessus]